MANQSVRWVLVLNVKPNVGKSDSGGRGTFLAGKPFDKRRDVQK